jgi:hypothetical protein
MATPPEDQVLDTPEICMARAADPAWVAEQKAKNEAASDRWIAYRESVNLPVTPKKRGERF